MAYPCSPDTTCNDIPGSYTCTCNVGYNGDGYNCTGKMFYFVPLLKQVKHFRQWHQFGKYNACKILIPCRNVYLKPHNKRQSSSKFLNIIALNFFFLCTRYFDSKMFCTCGTMNFVLILHCITLSACISTRSRIKICFKGLNRSEIASVNGPYCTTPCCVRRKRTIPNRAFAGVSIYHANSRNRLWR